MKNLNDLEGLARAGLLSGADIVQAHNIIDELAAVNSEAARMRERGQRLNAAVGNYRASMPRQWGLGQSLPEGDRS